METPRVSPTGRPRTWVPVSSSNLKAYYRRGKNTLEIKFARGAMYSYVYEGVPPQIIEEFERTTGSKGTFFDHYIKRGGYKCTPCASEQDSMALLTEDEQTQDNKAS